jgi:hypothetical protein
VAARKKKPWNAGLRLPGLKGEPPSKTPKPMPMGAAPTGLTTGHMVPPERWLVFEVIGEGDQQVRRPHMAGQHPWVGSESRARTEAAMLQRHHGGVWVAEKEMAQPKPKPPE